MSDIIGGEFAIEPHLIDPGRYFQFESDEYLYASGRGALYHILLNIKENHPIIDTILLPNYLCHSIIEVVQRADFKFIFYEINETLLSDTNKLINLVTQHQCLLLINYFGLIDTESIIREIKETIPESCIVLDNVQAFFAMKKKTRADYSFTSFRKWLPVPDGAIVKTNEKGMSIPKHENVFCQWRFAAGLLKNYRIFPEIQDKVYLHLFSEGEDLLSKEYANKISEICLSIMSQLDFTLIASTRKNNARFLFEHIKEINSSFLIINDESVYTKEVPMFFPIQINNRDMLRKKLFDAGIFCPVHWPVALPSPINSFYPKELSLVIDQRYSIQDMEHIIDIIKT